MENAGAPIAALRADAALNRARVANAAREAFAELGADAPIAEIARRAGVGTATLYRRFPTREDLLAFVFEDRIESCVATIEAFLRLPDPWDAFANYIRELCALQIEDRAFSAVLLRPFPDASPVEQERQRATAGLRALIERAEAAGVLHPDFREDDVVLLLKANDGVLARTPDNGAEASRRLTEWVLRSYRISP